MSFVSRVTMKITDLDALKSAVATLGGMLNEGQRTYKTHEGRAACDHAIVLKDRQEGDYEIGVVPNSDGSFSVSYDNWGPGRRLDAAFGAGAGRLKQEYGIASAEVQVARRLAPKGFGTITRERMPNGNVLLRVRRR